MITALISGKDDILEGGKGYDELFLKLFATLFQVMHLKESAASFSHPPALASLKPMARSVEQVNQPPITSTDRPSSSSNSVDNANNQEGEGMQLCYSAPISVSL